MHALIDSDIITYEFGSCVGEDGVTPLAWPYVASRVDSRIQSIINATEATSYTLYLTSDDKSNFRFDVATIKPYKGHRKSKKPYYYEKIREFLVEKRGAEVVYTIEADDMLSIEQMEDRDDAITCHHNYSIPAPDEDSIKHFSNTVICSRDKDLLMVPGYHYIWAAGGQKERKLWWQDEDEALKCFYRQLLTGDTVDNIPGLYGVGNSSKHLRSFDDMDSELQYFAAVKVQYEKRFGAYWWQFLKENSVLLWMLRTENTNEVVERLEELINQSFVQDLKKLSQNN